MISNKLPSVLTRKGYNSISTERALKQIRELLWLTFPTNNHESDMLNASLDDLEMMLLCIERGDS